MDARKFRLSCAPVQFTARAGAGAAGAQQSSPVECSSVSVEGESVKAEPCAASMFAVAPSALHAPGGPHMLPSMPPRRCRPVRRCIAPRIESSNARTSASKSMRVVRSSSSRLFNFSLKSDKLGVKHFIKCTKYINYILSICVSVLRNKQGPPKISEILSFELSYNIYGKYFSLLPFPEPLYYKKYDDLLISPRLWIYTYIGYRQASK